MEADTGHLGQKGREQITGYTGIATRRTQFLSGHTVYYLEREKSGDADGEWFDAARIIWLPAPDAIDGPAAQSSIENSQ